MPYQNLNHIMTRTAADRAALTRAQLFDLVDELLDNEIADGVPPAHIENFVNLLGDKLPEQPFSSQTVQAIAAIRLLLGRTFGEPMPAAGAAPAFMYRAAPLVFTGCSRTQLTLGLIVRLFDPIRIRQRGHPVCGPLVYMQALCRTNPVEYVRYVIGMAEAGHYQINGRLDVTPGTNIRTMPYRGTMAKVDYIAMASLRSSTAFWGYGHGGNIQTLQGATVPDTVLGWLRESGYNNITSNTRAMHGWFQRGLWSSARVSLATDTVVRSLTAAHTLIGQGSFVMMMVHPSLANGFRDGHFNNNRGSATMIAFGGHWVMLDSVTNITNAGATITISTWGVHCAPLYVPMSKLASWYWGYISGHP